MIYHHEKQIKMLTFKGWAFFMVHKGCGGVFLPHLSKIRNNGPKSITIDSNAENHVRFHKTSVNFRKYNFFADAPNLRVR